MQTFDTDTVGVMKAPAPPKSEAAASLRSEMEQRCAEAQSQASYHSGEARMWASVARACGAAVEQLTLADKEAASEPVPY